ncbi:hypothetical protein QR680_008322 [Steinernema hermaphroditum]|uniref:Granulins domain-containing protein n=1 Tax=Steinernema hermaphroditum TaxID=289476 RepID=A0AA39M7U5_9BILA|nr:hypothetical protein QR680_008322 [Steinernema hermaphroditum]
MNFVYLILLSVAVFAVTTGETQCQLSETSCSGCAGSMCCPLVNATCCPSGLRCCESGYVCDEYEVECRKPGSDENNGVAPRPFPFFF